MNPTVELIDGDVFEAEYQPVQQQEQPHGDVPVEHIWTVVEGDKGDLFAAPGCHVVNRLMYLVTVKPWEPGSMDAEWMIWPKCPNCEEPYDPDMDEGTDGIEWCSTCRHDASRSGYQGPMRGAPS